VALGLLASLVALAGAAPASNPVLVLIEPAVAVPAAARGLYVEDAWVRWPRAEGATGNRLLSLLTGEDWRGDPADYRFTQSGRDTWQAGNLARLKERGYLDAKIPAAALVLGPGRSRDVLLLAADEAAPVKPYGLEDKWPEGRLMVAQAGGWDDVAAIERGTQGRVLVLEYPPLEGDEVSRAWLRGNAWPQGRTNLAGTAVPALPEYKATGGIPGLIPAWEIGRLLTGSQEPKWVADPGPRWPGADRWVRYVREVGMGARALLGLAAFALLLWGVRLVSDERRSRSYFTGIFALALAIPVIVLAGSLTRLGGMAAWPVAFPVVGVALGAIAAGLYFASRRWLPLTHRLWPVALAAALASAIGEADYSALSGPLDLAPRPVAAEPMGLMLAGVLVLVAGARGERLAMGIGLGVAAGVALTGMAAGFALLPLLAVLAAHRRFRWWMGLALVPFTEGMQALLRGGAVYREGGLLRVLSDRAAFDIAPVVRFLISPALLLGVLALGSAWVFSPAFATHQIRRIWGRSPLARSLGRLSLALVPAGIFQPPVLDAAYIVLASAVFVLFTEAVWTSSELG
jgi:hypothetical protein